MEFIQIAGYSIAGGLLGYALPQLGWDLAQRQNGQSDSDGEPSAERRSDAGRRLPAGHVTELNRPVR